MGSIFVRAWRLLFGIVVANATGMLLFFVTYKVLPRASILITLPNLVLVPACMGIVAAWIWRPLDLGIGWTILHSLSATVVGVGLAMTVFREGAICIIIVSPLLYYGFLAGALVGRLWFRRNRDRLNALAAPVLALLALAEPRFRNPVTSVVQDEMLIMAPPGKVWPHVLEFGNIPEPPRYWLFRLGLPYPTRTTNSGNFVGAKRACVFSEGAVFQERIAQLTKEKVLTFDIFEMPPDPELLGHLDATRGEFELRDNEDGTTTLIGRTWYLLNVRPGWYFDWWTHEIFRAVHLRVMRNVKQLAEASP